MNEKIWLAPGKINLFLHITGQREDGYHELQTTFQFINWADELSFKISKTPQITLLSNNKKLQNNDNLVIKAAKLLQKHSKVVKGVKINLVKKLPFGAGLGGGSSDAATTLLALNELWQCGLSEQVLLKLGLELGADVPVFIHGKACWAEGIGEKFSDYNPPELDYYLVKPVEMIATQVLFADKTLKRDCPIQKVDEFEFANLNNVFEDVVKLKYPTMIKNIVGIVGQIQKQGFDSDSHIINNGFRMTGSGSCFFIPIKPNCDLRNINLPDGYSGRVIKTMNKAPKNLL